MNRQLRLHVATLAALVSLGFADLVSAQYAVEVVSYDEGLTPAPGGFVSAVAALGQPERFTGEGGGFPGAVTPFNPPFLASEIVSVGENGQLTLRFSNFVLPQSDGPEIGVFTNTGLTDIDYPHGQADDPVSAFGFDSAAVAVSSDGVTWVSLGNELFDIPTNGYNDAAQTITSNFQQPFTEPLSSFAGLSFEDPGNPDILELLDGSGGGKWLDISTTGLAQVGFIRFSVADDSDALSSLNFELDAVAIASNALGAATIPEPSTLFLATIASWMAIISRRRR